MKNSSQHNRIYKVRRASSSATMSVVEYVSLLLVAVSLTDDIVFFASLDGCPASVVLTLISTQTNVNLRIPGIDIGSGFAMISAWNAY